VPAVVAGVALALWATRTTLNVQSFMGAIMAIGVAVANSILLVTFAERSRTEGRPAQKAAVDGATGRLRPILMTSCAMVAGMVPMAAGLGGGGEQTAPLGRAVIGGLIGATLATLVVLPAIFALLQRDSTRAGASIHPDDDDDDDEMENGHMRQSRFVPGASNPVVVAALSATLAFAGGRARAQVPATAPATTVAVPASIEAYWSAELYAKTSGYVAEVKADIGDHVRAGDVLAVLRVPELEKGVLRAKAMLAARRQMSRSAEAAVAQAKVAVAVARQQLGGYQAEAKYQQLTLKRQEELSAGNAATPQQLDEARGKAEVARASVGTGEAKVAAAEADVRAAEANRDVAAAQVDVADAAAQEAVVMRDYTRITAPFDGVIVKRTASPGDLVQAATASRTTPLFTVQQLDVVRVFCDVPESKAAGVAAGAGADVKVYGLDGRVISATVTRLANSLDPATRTMRVEVDLKNPGEALRPGMYAQVTLGLSPAAKVAGPAARP
jgi:multidrug resistance efflux pump